MFGPVFWGLSQTIPQGIAPTKEVGHFPAAMADDRIECWTSDRQSAGNNVPEAYAWGDLVHWRRHHSQDENWIFGHRLLMHSTIGPALPVSTP